MEFPYFSDQEYEHIFFREQPLAKGEYENCVFRKGDFAGANLSGFRFIDCSFQDCNLALAKLSQTFLQQVAFRSCKMLGLRFDTSNAFGLSFSFEDCQLNNSVFYQLKIPKTVFRNCTLQEADFTECDLSAAVFDQCDLSGATFDNTLLEKADLRTALFYTIHPGNNRIRKAKFSTGGLAGLLHSFGIEISD